MSASDSNSFADFYLKDKQSEPESEQPPKAMHATEDFPGTNQNAGTSSTQNPFDRTNQATEIWSKQESMDRGAAVTEEFSPQSSKPETSWQNLSQSTNTDDQKSIADYMNQLLERVSEGVDTASHESNATPAKPKVDAVADRQSESQQTELPLEDDSSESMTVEVRLPKRAPEDRDGLNNMRQVANASATDALKTYDCRQLISRAYGNMIFVFAAMMLSCVLALVSSSVLSLAYAGAILSMLSAMVGILRFQMLSRQLSDAVQAECSAQNTEDA